MKLFYATLEPNEHNTDACAVTLYFEDTPTPEDVLEACLNLPSGLPLSVDTDDEFYSYDVSPTPVSTKAGLVRVQCHPTC